MATIKQADDHIPRAEVLGALKAASYAGCTPQAGSYTHGYAADAPAAVEIVATLLDVPTHCPHAEAVRAGFRLAYPDGALHDPGLRLDFHV